MSAPTVFLSAATIDLEPWRDTLHAVFEEAQLRPVCQNYNLGAPLHDVRHMLVSRIEQADCIIHLAGMGYGGHAHEPFADDPTFRCSWTQFEYYYAHSLGKPVIGVVLAPGLSTPGYVEVGADAAAKTLLQEAHRHRVTSGKFDGTPLAAKSRTMNREAKSIHDLFRVIAAAIGELHLLGAGGEKAARVLSLRPSRFQLPPVKAGFTGRETDLDALRNIDARGGGTSAVITGLGGMGGIGKSELAKVLAREWRPRFPDAQIWLDGFGTRTDPPPPSAGDLIAQVIRAFHPEAGQLPEELPKLQALYRQTLDGKKALVVLDNAAHPEVADQAGPLVPPEGCGLIVTSRRSFLVGGKAPHLVGRLSEPEAIDLLREICPALAEADAAAVAARCGGLPLALRLAGTHLALDGASPAAVKTYLAGLAGGRLAALDADAPDAGEDTIQETLRLSVDPLPAAERGAWLRLGVFTGDFDADAARAVAGEVADLAFLNRLVRRNLVERDTSSGDDLRYRLHDIAADYARDRLAAEGGEDALNVSYLDHARHYACVSRMTSHLYLAGSLLDGLALFDRERVQIEAAFAWLASRPDGGVADQALLFLVNGLVYTGHALRFHPRQSIAWFEGQATSAQRLKNLSEEGAAFCNLGIAHFRLGNANRAIKYHEKHLEIAREVGDRDGEANAFGNLGVAHGALGETRRAIEYYEQQLVIIGEIEDRRRVGHTLGNLGIAYRQLGDARRAIEYCEQALKIAREFGDRHGEANALGNLGSANLQLNETSRAIGYFEQALEIVSEIGDRRGAGAILGNLGAVHLRLGDARRAIWYFEQQFNSTRETGDRRSEGNALGNLASAHADLGDARRAISYYEDSLALHKETGDQRGTAADLWNAALAHEILGEQAAALERAESALAIFEAIEDPNAEKVRSRITVRRGE